MSDPFHKIQFCGAATVGTKGQIVIPAEAREALNIKTGDKLLVMNVPERGVLAILPEHSLDALYEQLSSKLETLRGVIKDKNK
jgi:AbrB family looped-hinge helix DNA binding protein